MAFVRPPIGPLRFRPPEPPIPWAVRRDTTQPGSPAPQNPDPLDHIWGERLAPGDEDCLSLDVCTPAVDGGRRPVMVCIHGGAFLIGSWIYCPPFAHARAADLLAFYPPWTVVNGMAFLVVGRLYWGRYYLVGLAHFLVAALMPLWLNLAPLIYGLFVGVVMSASAVDHIQTARREGPSP
jgi:hypothetical protein